MCSLFAYSATSVCSFRSRCPHSQYEISALRLLFILICLVCGKREPSNMDSHPCYCVLVMRRGTLGLEEREMKQVNINGYSID